MTQEMLTMHQYLKTTTTLKQIHMVAKISVNKFSIFPASLCPLLCCVHQTRCTLPAAASSGCLLGRVDMPPLVTLVLARTRTASRAAAGGRDRKAGEVSSTTIRPQILKSKSRVESAFLCACACVWEKPKKKQEFLGKKQKKTQNSGKKKMLFKWKKNFFKFLWNVWSRHTIFVDLWWPMT